VASTLAVLLCYSRLYSSKRSPSFRQLEFIVFGVAALLLRQTNIFWVAVFPAGLTLVWAVKASRGNARVTFDDNQRSVAGVAKAAWVYGRIYDPCVEKAYCEGARSRQQCIRLSLTCQIDYILTAISVMIVASHNLLGLLMIMIPYLALLAGFAGFVIGNGGVVLGEGLLS